MSLGYTENYPCYRKLYIPWNGWNYMVHHVLKAWLVWSVHTVVPYFDAKSIIDNQMGIRRVYNLRPSVYMMEIGNILYWMEVYGRSVVQYWQTSFTQNKNPNKVVSASGLIGMCSNNEEYIFHTKMATSCSVDGFLLLLYSLYLFKNWTGRSWINYL